MMITVTERFGGFIPRDGALVPQVCLEADLTGATLEEFREFLAANDIPPEAVFGGTEDCGEPVAYLEWRRDERD